MWILKWQSIQKAFFCPQKCNRWWLQIFLLNNNFFSYWGKTYFSQAFAWKVRQSWQKYGWVVVIQTNQLWRKFLFCWLPFVPTSPQYYLLFCKSIEAILRQSKHNISKVSKHSSSKTSSNTYLHSWFIETQGFLIWMLCSNSRNEQDLT